MDLPLLVVLPAAAAFFLSVVESSNFLVCFRRMAPKSLTGCTAAVFGLEKEGAVVVVVASKA